MDVYQTVTFYPFAIDGDRGPGVPCHYVDKGPKTVQKSLVYTFSDRTLERASVWWSDDTSCLYACVTVLYQPRVIDKPPQGTDIPVPGAITHIASDDLNHGLPVNRGSGGQFVSDNPPEIVPTPPGKCGDYLNIKGAGAAPRGPNWRGDGPKKS